MAKDLASLRNFVIRPCLCLDHRSQEARTKCRTWTDALLQEIILKANSVETGGDQTARTMRSSGGRGLQNLQILGCGRFG